MLAVLRSRAALVTDGTHRVRGTRCALLSGQAGGWESVRAQVLLRFNTFFKVGAQLHAEADKKRVLHELAACACRAMPDAAVRGV